MSGPRRLVSVINHPCRSFIAETALDVLSVAVLNAALLMARTSDERWKITINIVKIGGWRNRITGVSENGEVNTGRDGAVTTRENLNLD